MENFVARQPIFDISNDVYAYELLYRKNMAVNAFDETMDLDQASTRTLINSFVDIGLDKLTGGRKAFVNFTEKLLRYGIPSLLSPDQLVIEVLENIPPTKEVLDACVRLKNAGFTIAMDDFILDDETSTFLDFADIVKVDFLQTPVSDIAILAQYVHELRDMRPPSQPLRLLAEKIENNDIFAIAKDMGFEYFQGYYFSKPVIVAGRSLSPTAINRVRLLQLSMQQVVNFDDVADVIKQDVALSYRLLQFVNSAYFGFHAVISNIQQALVVLGTTEVRKWMALMCLIELNQDKTAELTRMALIRARFLELIAPVAGRGLRAETFYLMGMFSLMDVLMEMPMDEVFSQIHVDDAVSAPLLAREGPDYELLHLIELYERGDFDSAADLASSLSLPVDKLADTYLEAVQWSSILAI
ncbi:MAG: HDOD domain-containing protein [Acidobacteriota bacterium]|jgi:EAL and modified HD-GYP domain-containing signal transduction protein|nr:HDOD domain-containing protein [Acidobacteriota bacterium]